MELIKDVEISLIQKNPNQPRKVFRDEEIEELARSIEELGLIHPPTVRRLAQHSYELIAGERRLLACQRLGLKRIPIYVREASLRKSAFAALAENMQRVDLNPLEVANSLYLLMEEEDLSQEELAKKMGKKRSTIANFLRLLSLPPQIQKELLEKKITMGHAKAILAFDTLEARLMICRQIIDKGLSVRQAETRSRHKKAKKTRALPLLEWEKRLTRAFRRKVEIRGKRVIIPFFSEEDLHSLCEEASQSSIE